MTDTTMKNSLTRAKRDINAVFGSKHAEDNPALVGAYLQAEALREIDDTLVEAIENLNKAVGKVSKLSSFLNFS